MINSANDASMELLYMIKKKKNEFLDVYKANSRDQSGDRIRKKSLKIHICIVVHLFSQFSVVLH